MAVNSLMSFVSLKLPFAREFSQIPWLLLCLSFHKPSYEFVYQSLPTKWHFSREDGREFEGIGWGEWFHPIPVEIIPPQIPSKPSLQKKKKIPSKLLVINKAPWHHSDLGFVQLKVRYSCNFMYFVCVQRLGQDRLVNPMFHLYLIYIRNIQIAYYSSHLFSGWT